MKTLTVNYVLTNSSGWNNSSNFRMLIWNLSSQTIFTKLDPLTQLIMQIIMVSLKTGTKIPLFRNITANCICTKTRSHSRLLVMITWATSVFTQARLFTRLNLSVMLICPILRILSSGRWSLPALPLSNGKTLATLLSLGLTILNQSLTPCGVSFSSNLRLANLKISPISNGFTLTLVNFSVLLSLLLSRFGTLLNV